MEVLVVMIVAMAVLYAVFGKGAPALEDLFAQDVAYLRALFPEADIVVENGRAQARGVALEEGVSMVALVDAMAKGAKVLWLDVPIALPDVPAFVLWSSQEGLRVEIDARSIELTTPALSSLASLEGLEIAPNLMRVHVGLGEQSRETLLDRVRDAREAIEVLWPSDLPTLWVRVLETSTHQDPGDIHLAYDTLRAHHPESPGFLRVRSTLHEGPHLELLCSVLDDALLQEHLESWSLERCWQVLDHALGMEESHMPEWSLLSRLRDHLSARLDVARLLWALEHASESVVWVLEGALEREVLSVEEAAPSLGAGLGWLHSAFLHELFVISSRFPDIAWCQVYARMTPEEVREHRDLLFPLIDRLLREAAPAEMPEALREMFLRVLVETRGSNWPIVDLLEEHRDPALFERVSQLSREHKGRELPGLAVLRERLIKHAKDAPSRGGLMLSEEEGPAGALTTIEDTRGGLEVSDDS